MRSRVAVIGETIVGLGMLGRRQDQGWVTRLGVLPEGRRQGIGRAILIDLLHQAAQSDLPEVWLEVIKGNQPALELFRRYDFQQTRELIVAAGRRGRSPTPRPCWRRARSTTCNTTRSSTCIAPGVNA